MPISIVLRNEIIKQIYIGHIDQKGDINNYDRTLQNAKTRTL